MITQTELNTIIERARILTQLYNLNEMSHIILDIQEFFYKIKSLDDLESTSNPSAIGACPYENYVYIEWENSPDNIHLDELRVEFHGNQAVKLSAEYSSFNLSIKSEIPIDDDFANIMVSHLQNFKQPIKKKKYK